MTETSLHDELLARRNVVGVYRDPTDDTLTAIVSQKLPEDELSEADLVSQAVDEDTQVVDAGEGRETDALEPLILDRDAPISAYSDRHERHRPVETGVSEILSSSTAATGGHWPARVTDTTVGEWSPDVSEGDIVRLSNSHVYADSGNAEFGASIIQPSPMDGGTESNKTGELAGYAPLVDGVTVDVAARTSSVGEKLSPHELPGGWPTGVIRGDYASLSGEKFKKSGRTTGVTDSTLRGVGASVRVRYPEPAGVVTLRDLLVFGDFSDGGDSGSPVYTTDGEIVGLLFAGSQRLTAVCTVANVEAELGVELMSEEPQTHEPEQSYETWKVEQLEAEFGAENVERQVHLDTGRRVDILVHDTERGVRMAFELENDSGSTINGSGQASHYARQVFREDSAGGVVYPVLAVPEGHIDADERHDLESAGIRVVEDDVPETVSIEGV